MQKTMTVAASLAVLAIAFPSFAEEGVPASGQAPESALNSKTAEQVRALDARITELEALSLLNHFRFGGFLITQLDLIDYRPNNDASQKNRTYPMLMRFGLNVDVDVSDQVKFHSRLGMSGLYVPFPGAARASTQTKPLDGGSYTNTSTLVYLDRAFFDYHLHLLPLTFSVGRLPRIEGPPYNIPDGEPRMGTYPRMSCNVPVDGFALTLSFAKWLPSNQALALRGVFTPIGQLDVGRPYKQLAVGETRYTSSMPGGAAMLDYSWRPSRFLESANAILQYVHSGLQEVAPSVSAPNQGITGDYAFTPQFLTGYLELNNLGHVGLDLSLSFTEAMSSSKGTWSVMTPGGPVPVLQGKSRDWGSALLISARYQLNTSTLRYPFLGAEYLWSTSDYLNQDMAPDDLTDFYVTAGRAFLLYYTQPVSAGLSLRIGYRQQNYNCEHHGGKPSGPFERPNPHRLPAPTARPLTGAWQMGALAWACSTGESDGARVAREAAYERSARDARRDVAG